MTSFAYTAYGAPVGASSGTYAYGTYGYDSATGLYYARARYYDPGSGRFLSEDPRPATNLFPYASSDPTNAYDPTGEGVLIDYETTTSQRVRAATQGVKNLPQRVILGERQILKHILPRHSWGANIPGESEFFASRNIQADILEALRAPAADYAYGENGNILIRFAFDQEIGVTNVGSISCFIQVVIRVTGKVISAYVV